MEDDYNKLALHPSVLLSVLIEQGLQSGPIYVKTPEKLIELLGSNTVLLYPFEWTEDEANAWLKEDVEEFKLEDAKEHPEDYKD